MMTFSTVLMLMIDRKRDYMNDRLSMIKELNKLPLGKHSKKLLKQDNEAVVEDELYLVQVARQITENFYVQDYIRKNLMLLTHDNLLADLYDMYDEEPKEQMKILLNADGNGSMDDLMKCTELYQMALVIMQTLIDKRVERDGNPYDNM